MRSKGKSLLLRKYFWLQERDTKREFNCLELETVIKKEQEKQTFIQLNKYRLLLLMEEKKKSATQKRRGRPTLL